MKKIILWIVFVLMLFVIVKYVLETHIIYAILFALCDLLVLKICITNKKKK